MLRLVHVVVWNEQKRRVKHVRNTVYYLQPALPREAQFISCDSFTLLVKLLFAVRALDHSSSWKITSLFSLSSKCPDVVFNLSDSL
eukprot:Em0014g476a